MTIRLNSLTNDSGRFGRMFPNLILNSSNLLADSPANRASLLALGAEMVDNAGAVLDSAIPTVFTYFGQFVDHDITFDPTSNSDAQNDPEATQNFRTPGLNLDSMYGTGPADQPYLYVKEADGFRRRLQVVFPTGTPTPNDVEDLFRATDSTAIIGDPRNDENLVVAQLHLAFQLFHNEVLRRITPVTPANQRFLVASLEVKRHYQWLVLHDYLSRVVRADTLNSVLSNGPTFFVASGSPFIPIEFSVAAYRFGHSLVREVYKYNHNFQAASLNQLFGFAQGNGTVPASWKSDWSNMTEVPGGSTPQFTRAIDSKLTPSLHQLPPFAGSGSLAQRNLLRGLSFNLPSGQAVAKLIGATELTAQELSADSAALSANPELLAKTPLWYYILKESELKEGGQRLGVVGSRILSEVFVFLLLSDKESILRTPGWAPSLGATPGKFTMWDMFVVAGVGR